MENQRSKQNRLKSGLMRAMCLGYSNVPQSIDVSMDYVSIIHLTKKFPPMKKCFHSVFVLIKHHKKRQGMP
ncbi:hypothetical protein C2G38_2127375 [Gigaspora rosea]|uniref:Uncharacterized protein n=1 Tax=Gigaspora rosea TaxID=44941 RepID=A0A397TXM4_9GLOM|nr:hypothetical protein C2G38_2127375 [Gigaspora rosea]